MEQKLTKFFHKSKLLRGNKKLQNVKIILVALCQKILENYFQILTKPIIKNTKFKSQKIFWLWHDDILTFDYRESPKIGKISGFFDFFGQSEISM